jgi:hypothetical protein
MRRITGSDSRHMPELQTISFPNVNILQLEGENELLASLDISNADTLEFRSTSDPLDRLFAPIPSLLTTLILEFIIFTPESLSTGQRHFLPYLINLTLLNVVFLGPMRKYFHCPKLIRLRYSIKSPDFVCNTIVENSKNPYQAPAQETFDEAFFQETPVLGSISLEGTAMDRVLVLNLASCSSLHELTIKGCSIERFIHPFLEKWQEAKYLPSLRTLRIDNSWPLQFGMSVAEFRARCAARRPLVDVIGNNRRASAEILHHSRLNLDPDNYVDSGGSIDSDNDLS